MRDVIEQYIRCYTEPVKGQRKKVKPKMAGDSDTPIGFVGRVGRTPDLQETDIGRALDELLRPWGGWCIVFDTETLTGINQSARLGVCSLYGIAAKTRIQRYVHGKRTRDALGVDVLSDRWLFYDPDVLSPAEIRRVTRYADVHTMRCITRAEFITDVFYPWAYERGALVIGHNLVFDLGALCRPGQWDVIKQGTYNNGFRMGLCDCGAFPCSDHPPIRAKHIGAFKDKIAFQPPNDQAWKKGRFLDTAMLGRALLGPDAMSLDGMGKRFNAAVLKSQDKVQHGGEIDDRYLDYAVNDVEATWSLYCKERDLYRLHGVSRAMWTIYSEASLGKAYLHDLGVPSKPYTTMSPDVLGYGMVALYGGRSEVKVRLQPTEVIYTDFKSQYPSAQAMMRLQDLWLAERIDTRTCTDEWRDWLQSATLDDMRQRDTWRRRLRCLVKIRPRGDVLPVRAEYGPDGTNIGLVVVDDGLPVWYTAADVVTSLLLTGKAPDVLDVIELVPVGRVETKPWRLFGDERYTIDLSRDDFFATVIKMRGDVKKARDTHANGSPDWLYYDSLQNALKLLANSTSYGVFVEVNQEEPTAEPRPLRVYGLSAYTTTTRVIEQPGPYFAGPIGALITGGGRLLLGLAERLAADRGIGYALMDTDSIAFARPDDMDRETFRQHVNEICAWFAALSPYGDGQPLLEMEDVNYATGTDGAVQKGVFEPLYFIGVSAKRYALYNRDANGTPIIRKFSSHGVGTWQGRTGYTSPPHVPAPWTSVRTLANGSGERWMYDLWYDAIVDVEAGNTRHLVTGGAWLDQPAFYQVTVSTGHVATRYRDVPGLRPYGFFTALPPLTKGALQRRDPSRLPSVRVHDGATTKTDYDVLEGKPFYAPFANAVDELHDIRYLDDDGVSHAAPDGIQYVTLTERLEQYFTHAEWKAADPHGVGVLQRRHVRVVALRDIGKESNQVMEELHSDTDGALVEWHEQHFSTTGVAATLTDYPMADLQAVTGLPRRTLYNIIGGDAPTPRTFTKIMHGLTLLDRAPQGTFAGWQRIPTQWLAEQTGLTMCEIDDIRSGRLDVPDGFYDALIAALARWKGGKPTGGPLTWREHRRLRQAIRALGGIRPPKNPDGTLGRWSFSARLQSAHGKDIKAVMRHTRDLHGCVTVADFVQVVAASSGKD